jgi:hypothetical protein
MPLKILNDEPLILTPHPNGGWTIMQTNLREPGLRDKALGAYTTAQDMLRDLGETLMPDYVHTVTKTETVKPKKDPAMPVGAAAEHPDL